MAICSFTSGTDVAFRPGLTLRVPVRETERGTEREREWGLRVGGLGFRGLGFRVLVI